MLRSSSELELAEWITLNSYITCSNKAFFFGLSLQLSGAFICQKLAHWLSDHKVRIVQQKAENLKSK